MPCSIGTRFANDSLKKQRRPFDLLGASGSLIRRKDIFRRRPVISPCVRNVNCLNDESIFGEMILYVKFVSFCLTLLAFFCLTHLAFLYISFQLNFNFNAPIQFFFAVVIYNLISVLGMWKKSITSFFVAS